MGQSVHLSTLHGSIDRVDRAAVVGRHHAGVWVQILIPVAQALDASGAGGF